MNKRKQIITDVLLNDDFSNVQESMNTLGFTKLQQYVDYLDGCYSHVTNLEHFREQQWKITNRSSREQEFCMTEPSALRYK